MELPKEEKEALFYQKAHGDGKRGRQRWANSLCVRLPRAGDDNDGDEGTTTRDSSKKKKRKTASQPRTRGPRRITFREQQLVGETFEDDGVDWKVLDVAWSDEVEPPQVVVFNYDKEAAVAEGVLENDLLEALDEAGDHSNAEHIEWSTVSEVRAWLLASGRTT